MNENTLLVITLLCYTFAFVVFIINECIYKKRYKAIAEERKELQAKIKYNEQLLNDYLKMFKIKSQ